MPTIDLRAADIDIGNTEGVGVHADDIVIIRYGARMTRDRALVLAAWLVALADETGGKRFQEIMLAVLDT